MRVRSACLVTLAVAAVLYTSVIPAAPVIEEVVAVAKQPGPKLWRVSQGDHELWILGMLSPLPKDLQWDDASVDAVLADADEFIESPGVSVNANPLKLAWAAPKLWGIQKLPDGKKLEDVLPEEQYVRWQVLKTQYLGKDRAVERKRPILAATSLYDQALDKSGLVGNTSAVYEQVRKLIKRHKVPTTSTSLTRRLTRPGKAISNFKKSSIDDIECFTRTLDRIETDLPKMQSRALAWATGDIDTIRALPYDDQNLSCINAVLTSNFASDLAQELELDDIESQLRESWLEAARLSLENNPVSFATLPLSQLLDSNGYVATLAAEGYTVRGP